MILAVVDRHRERKSRNLIPARLGIYSIFVFAFHQICEQFAYNALRTKVNTKTDEDKVVLSFKSECFKKCISKCTKDTKNHT